MKTPRPSWLAFVLLAVCVPVRAQLAVWDVNGVNSGSANPLAATALGSNIGSASLSLGSGVTASATASTFGGSAFNTTALSTAITGADYISFTIAPGAGYALNLSSISFNSSVATPVTSFHAALLSSATGFAAGNEVHTYSFSAATAPLQSITLSGISALQNAATSIEFRLYGWRDVSGTSTFRIRDLTGHDLVITGSVTAVPEPATYAAIAGAVALVGVAIRKRRLSRTAWVNRGRSRSPVFRKARQAGGLCCE